jgi:hypothetical protein
MNHKPWTDYGIYTTLLTFRNCAQKVKKYQPFCSILNSAQRELPVYSARSVHESTGEEYTSYKSSCVKFLEQYHSAGQAIFAFRKRLLEYSHDGVGMKLDQVKRLFDKLCVTSETDIEQKEKIEMDIRGVLEDLQSLRPERQEAGQEWLVLIDADVVFEELGRIWGWEKRREQEAWNRVRGLLEWEMGLVRIAVCVVDGLTNFFEELLGSE